MSASTPPKGFLQSAERTIRTEAQAVLALLEQIGPEFEAACGAILACKGRVVVTGMGKSGHIANKIAATLASTGTPAFYVHPAEASHGDLGMITREDLVLALSNSGGTSELLSLLPLLKRLAIPLIGMTGNADSALARSASHHLLARAENEACPLGLAPTSSTTVALVLGDALAVALLEARGFTAEDFAFSHPGGALGKRLLLKVEDIMHTGERIPCCHPRSPFTEALLEMSRKGLGMICVVDAENHLLGVFTDGDLRRAFAEGIDVHAAEIGQLMTAKPRSTQPNALAAQALGMMEEFKINALPVADQQGRLVGALNMHDLLRSGVL